MVSRVFLLAFLHAEVFPNMLQRYEWLPGCCYATSNAFKVLCGCKWCLRGC